MTDRVNTGSAPDNGGGVPLQLTDLMEQAPNPARHRFFVVIATGIAVRCIPLVCPLPWQASVSNVARGVIWAVFAVALWCLLQWRRAAWRAWGNAQQGTARSVLWSYWVLSFVLVLFGALLFSGPIVLTGAMTIAAAFNATMIIVGPPKLHGGGSYYGAWESDGLPPGAVRSVLLDHPHMLIGAFFAIYMGIAFLLPAPGPTRYTHDGWRGGTPIRQVR